MEAAAVVMTGLGMGKMLKTKSTAQICPAVATLGFAGTEHPLSLSIYIYGGTAVRMESGILPSPHTHTAADMTSILAKSC